MDEKELHSLLAAEHMSPFEDPNTLVVSAQEPLVEMPYAHIEFAAWSDFVRIYVGQGKHMKEAITLADEYIIARRKRAPTPST